MEGEEIESDISDTEILKRKILVVDKLLKHKEKLELQKSELTTENLLKDNIITSLKTENSELKHEVEQKIEKIKELEVERRNQSTKLGQQDTVIAKKNCELINKDLELNELNRKIDNLSTENETLQDKIKNDKAIKKLKEVYEAEKWKYLAEISTLKQENEALREAAKEKEEISNAFKVDLEELEKYKKENTALKKALNESKKDRQIQSLARKLDKAQTEIRKISQGLDPTNTTLVDLDEKNSSLSFTQSIQSHLQRRRFPILNLKRKLRMREKRIKFRKFGSLLYADVPSVLDRKPILSDSIPSSEPDMLEDNLKWLFSQSGDGPGLKRKRDLAVTPPPPKKSRKISPKKETRVKSHLKDVSLTCQDNSEGSMDCSQRSELSEVLQTVDKSASEEVQPLSSSTPVRADKKSEPPAPGPSIAAESLSQDKSELYFNPNPVKARIAHKLINIEPIHPVKKPRSDSKMNTQQLLTKSRGAAVPPPPSYSPQKKTNARVTREPTQQDRKTGPATELSARAKIIDSGLKIETPSNMGKKLTEAQIAAAKNRMVGRAPPGVATRPSVDGFRSSEPLVRKSDVASGKKNPAKLKTTSKTEDTDFSFPARRRTMPARLSLHSKSSELSRDEKGNVRHQTADVQMEIGPTTRSSAATRQTSSTQQITSKSVEITLSSNDTSPSSETQVETSTPLVSAADTAVPADAPPAVKSFSSSESISAELKPPPQPDKQQEKELRTSLDDDLEMSDESEDERAPSPPAPSAKVETGEDRAEAEGNTVKPIDDLQRKKQESGNSGDLQQEKAISRKSLPNSFAQQRKYRNLLDELLGEFKLKEMRDKAGLQRMRSKILEKQNTFEYQTFKTVIEKSVRRLTREVSKETLESICDELCQGEDAEMNETMICDYLYNFLMDEHKSVKLLNELNSDAPPVTRNQQRTFILLTVLKSKPRYTGVMDRMIDLIYHGFFGIDRMYNMNMSSILSLGRMFVLCARFTGDLEIMKKFLFDLFFFKSPRNHLLVGVVLDLWPDVFYKPDGELSPELETVIWSIFNTGDVKSTSDMKVLETRDILTSRHGYIPSSFQPNSMIEKYIKMAENSLTDHNVLNSVKYSLFLLGRGNNFNWVNNRIVAKLFKLLTAAWTEERENVQVLRRWVIETLGWMCRLYPAEGRSKLTDLFDFLKNLIILEDKVENETLESCLVTLVQLGYHLQEQLARFLVSWKPLLPLSPHIKRIIEDFVGTRGRKHAEITNNIARSKENKKRKFNGVF